MQRHRYNAFQTSLSISFLFLVLCPEIDFKKIVAPAQAAVRFAAACIPPCAHARQLEDFCADIAYGTQRVMIRAKAPDVQRPGLSPPKGSRKNNFTFYTPIHLFQLRCESSEYQNIPAFSRLAGRALQCLIL
jgi:hypothetical protein